MQLTWKSKPVQSGATIFSKQTDDPFYLEPLSLQAFIHARDRDSRARPHKPRKFRFIAHQALGKKQTSGRSCDAPFKQSPAYSNETKAGASVEQSNIKIDRSNHQCTPASPLLDTLDAGVYGEMKHPI